MLPEFFIGENMNPDGMVALLDYREDGVTPYMIFFKDGLEMEKCVSIRKWVETSRGRMDLSQVGLLVFATGMVRTGFTTLFKM